MTREAGLRKDGGMPSILLDHTEKSLSDPNRVAFSDGERIYRRSPLAGLRLVI